MKVTASISPSSNMYNSAWSSATQAAGGTYLVHKLRVAGLSQYRGISTVYGNAIHYQLRQIVV